MLNGTVPVKLIVLVAPEAVIEMFANSASTLLLYPVAVLPDIFVVSMSAIVIATLSLASSAPRTNVWLSALPVELALTT